MAHEGGVAAGCGFAKKAEGDGANKEVEDGGLEEDVTKRGEKKEDEATERKENEDEVGDEKEDATGCGKQLLRTSFESGWSIPLGCRDSRSGVRRQPPFFSFAPVGNKERFLKMLS